jgi:hypothetical protein
MMNSAPASVLDYGADPTGAADSSVAIQTAINANNVVHIPEGLYRCDNAIIIESSYTNRKLMTMTAATKLRRMSAFSVAEGPVIELVGNYGHFDGGFGELESENDSPRGVVVLGQRDTNTLSTGNGLFWSFSNCDVRCKNYAIEPTVAATVGVYIPSAAPEKGSNFANYFGTVSNVRVFRASISYWLTDQVNANTFVNCGVEFFWHYAWRFNGAYGNTIYSAFVNGCYKNGGYVFFLGNKLFPSAPNPASHQSSDNNIFGATIELYTSGNFGVYIPAGVSGFDSVRNFAQICWNSSGTALTDLTTGKGNTVFDGVSSFSLGTNFAMPNQTAAGFNLMRVGTSAYPNAHAIARTAPAGGPSVIIENLNTAASVAAGLQVRWNTPTIGYGGAIISTFHTPSATTRFQVIDNGDCQNTNGVYAAISDAKLKDIIGLATSQWGDVKFLASKLTKYSLKSDPDKKAQIGWIAQEIEEQCPGLVFETPDVRSVESVDENGDRIVIQEPTGETTKGVRYSIANLKAFKALGEALERIESLEAEVAALKVK